MGIVKVDKASKYRFGDLAEHVYADRAEILGNTIERSADETVLKIISNNIRSIGER